MELVPGSTLKERAKDHPLPVAEAVDAILQVIGGLAAAQAKGLLHRDIKPSNCFVTDDGKVKIGDFGLSISTLARAETHLTTTGMFLGTPAFASPEQLQGRALEVQSDIYSVGATLWFYLLTGRPLFETGNAVELVAAILHESPPSPRVVRSEVPKRLARTVLRCLSKDASDRWSSYAELKRTLLPFSSLQLTPASRQVRFMTFLIEICVWGLPIALVAGSAVLGGIDTVGWLLLIARGVVYLSVTDGIWGASLGKALAGLQLVDLSRGSPPVLRKAFTRAAVFFMTPALLTPLLLWGHPAVFFVLLPLSALVPFRGLHETLSKTRVVLRPPGVRRAAKTHGAHPAPATAELLFALKSVFRRDHITGTTLRASTVMASAFAVTNGVVILAGDLEWELFIPVWAALMFGQQWRAWRQVS